MLKVRLRWLGAVLQYSCKSIAHIPLEMAFALATNANKMDTNNMKCTCPTRDFCIGDLTQPIFHWLALGFCFGGNTNFLMFRVGLMQILVF